MKNRLYYLQLTYIPTQMDIENLTTELKFPNRIGATLSTEQLISLQSSVLKLSHEYNYEQFHFWGRVQGTSRNYYIVVGVNFKGATHFPQRKYFWSSQDFKFAELPSMRKDFVKTVEKMPNFFTGQHEKIITKETGQGKKVINIDGEDFSVKAKHFTELDRLSIVVHLIDHDCQVVPLGAFKMLPTHQLIRDPAFRGLKIEQSTNLQNYGHLRAPEHKEKQTLIECDKALERNDFLDTLDQDYLKESWSVQADESKTEITIRSLLWPGYVGYHRSNSVVFGGIYMGTGIRCADFAFVV